MSKVWVGLLMMVVLGCTNKDEEIIVMNPRVESDWKAKVDKLMSAQEDSWNTGDLEGFMGPYLKADSLLFVGSRGLTKGWTHTLNNYKRSYPTDEKMGKLTFNNDEYKVLGAEHALVVGRWLLLRKTDTLKGAYSLIWQKINGEWKIIADHSS